MPFRNLIECVSWCRWYASFSGWTLYIRHDVYLYTSLIHQSLRRYSLRLGGREHEADIVLVTHCVEGQHSRIYVSNMNTSKALVPHHVIPSLCIKIFSCQKHDVKGGGGCCYLTSNPRGLWNRIESSTIRFIIQFQPPCSVGEGNGTFNERHWTVL